MGVFAHRRDHVSGRNHPALLLHPDIVAEKGGTYPDPGQPGDDPCAVTARKRQVPVAAVVRDAQTLLQQRGYGLLQDPEASATQPELDGNAVGSGEGELHQRTAHDCDRRMDQLDVFGLRNHEGAVPADPSL